MRTMKGADRPTSVGGSSWSERFLFGGRLKYDLGFNRHEEAVLDLSLWEIARRFPALVGTALSLAYQADRRSFRRLLTAELLQGIAAAVLLISAENLIQILLASGMDPSVMRPAIPYLAVVAAATAVRSLMSAVSLTQLGKLEPRIERVATEQYLERVVKVELAAIEDPEFHRLLDSAQHGSTGARQMLSACGALLNTVTTFLATASVLTVLHPILLPLLFLVTLPRSWGALKNARARHRSIHAWIDHERAAKLISGLLIERHSAPEIRVHGAGRFLLDRFRDLAQESEREQERLARSAARVQFAAACLTGVAMVLAYGVLAGLLMAGVVGLAIVGTTIISMRMGVANLSALMTQVNSLCEEALFVGDLQRLYAEAERRAVPPGGRQLSPDIERIIFENVSFSYPGSCQPALRDLSVTIPKGSVTAFVGGNGSGKTTLLKLLAGLYTADHGRITWDGNDTRELDRDALQSHIAMVAQDFKRWPFTVRANVAISRPDVQMDEERMRESVAYAGADAVVADLPSGWDTLLARGYRGGCGISGGQWQRLGIARAHYRQAPLLIVDEPTSALDARAEAEIFEKILKQKDPEQTVVLVTHRMASVRAADFVYVLENGAIVESGTPDQLVHEGGIYSELFELQAKAYVVEDAVES
ncbi:ABC transporter ATP-binding protein [Streptomyces violarus]|uniref:ABC transporter ATP-binding protein n=1 Tax=Streptomyces violarus TaxID=67380 RepID=UPI0021BF9FFB|nr:ABC transporter ATP-binding protein [Streptomyces violarus]MCT9139771.1 ABC transporter ATP-binding protein/permease [Streptomyces violarus]